MGANVGPTGPTVIVVNGGNQNPAPPQPMRCPLSHDSLSMARHHAHKKKKKHFLHAFAAAIGLTALAVIFRKHIPQSFRFWESAKPVGYSLPLHPLSVEQQAAHNVISSEMRSGKSWEDITKNEHFQKTSQPHLFQDAINVVQREDKSNPYNPTVHNNLLKDMCNDTRTFGQHDLQNGVERMLFSGHNNPDFDACIRHKGFDPNRVDNQGHTLYQRLSDNQLHGAAEKLKTNPNFYFGDRNYFLTT
jgi:hypothetical protein